MCKKCIYSTTHTYANINAHIVWKCCVIKRSPPPQALNKYHEFNRIYRHEHIFKWKISLSIALFYRQLIVQIENYYFNIRIWMWNASTINNNNDSIIAYALSICTFNHVKTHTLILTHTHAHKDSGWTEEKESDKHISNLAKKTKKREKRNKTNEKERKKMTNVL